MMMTKRSKKIVEALEIAYPNAKCGLNYNNNFELLIAVVLSAQTSDEAVNKVSINLFKAYPDCISLSKANVKEVETLIKNIGLYKNKAKYIIDTANSLVNNYNGQVPSDYKSLRSLSGVGNKTAKVVLNEAFGINTFAVDRHVERIAKRLDIASINDDILTVETKLMNYFNKNAWGKLHHQFINLGREICTSKNPKCNICPLNKICKTI